MNGQEGSGGAAPEVAENDLRETLLPKEGGEIEEAPETSENGTNMEASANGDGGGGVLQRLPSLRPSSLLDSLLGALGPGKNGEPDYSNRKLLGGWVRVGRDGFRRRVSMVLICFLVLVGDANRGLVLPTLQEYIGIYGGNSSVVSSLYGIASVLFFSL